MAAVVDPRRDIDIYVKKAAEQGLKIKHVLLTHFHADFLAGHLELRERVGATIHLGAQANAEYATQPLADGDVLDLGGADGVRLKILETPGHTPESISILVYERASDPEPHAVLTGDTLFIGDVGRPDLLASIGFTAEDLAEQLYDSLHEKLLPLPDATLLYPGHGAGSACGKSMSTETVCTIGRQREFNYALQPMSKEAFVAEVTAGQTVQPAYFALDARLNREEHATLDATLAKLQTLSLEEVLRLKNQGAQLLDVDSPAEFGAGHLVDSVNVGIGGRYASWAGSVLDAETPIVIIAPKGKEQEAAIRLGRIGFDQVVGFLEGGKAALKGRDDLVKTIRRLDVAELRAALASEEPPAVLDVRTPGEREEARIEGSVHIPLKQLRERMEEVPTARPLVVHCKGGYRSMIASSLLARAGIASSDLDGGFNAWLGG